MKHNLILGIFISMMFSQVTITVDDLQYETGGNYSMYNIPSPQGVIGLTGITGGPHIFDFSYGPTASILTIDYVGVSDGGHGSDFPNATIAERRTDENGSAWMYLDFESGQGRINYGFYDEVNVPESPSVPFNPSIIDFSGNISYQSYFTGNTNFNVMMNGIDINIAYEFTGFADAYGTVILPDGLGERECIQINYAEEFTYYWMDVPIQYSYIRSYYYLAEGLGIVAIITSLEEQSPIPNDFNIANTYARLFDTSKLAEEEIEVSHFDGWNLVGLPVEVDNSSYETLFPDAIPGTLYSYDAINGYISENELVPGNGYWLRFDDASSNFLSGQSFEQVSVSLTEGWNIVSGISVDVELPVCIDDPEGLIVPGTIYGWEGVYTAAEIIEPGKGYWIRSYGDGEITIFNPLDRNVDNSDFEMVNHGSGMNSLIFSDNKNRHVELYFGRHLTNADELSFSLPPAPPAGGFDVRFADDMKFSENGGEIFIQNKHWPLLVEFRNPHSEIPNIEKLVTVDWYLVDEISGKEYAFNEGGAIEISEPTERLTLYRSTLTPEHFALQQNYPNPFNPSTTIQYTLETHGNASLQIFDIKGRLVETLVSGEITTGTHSVIWDASNVSSGIYIYKLISGSNQITKKMILLK